MYLSFGVKGVAPGFISLLRFINDPKVNTKVYSVIDQVYTETDPQFIYNNELLQLDAIDRQTSIPAQDRDRMKNNIMISMEFNQELKDRLIQLFGIDRIPVNTAIMLEHLPADTEFDLIETRNVLLNPASGLL